MGVDDFFFNQVNNIKLDDPEISYYKESDGIACNKAECYNKNGDVINLDNTMFEAGRINKYCIETQKAYRASSLARSCPITYGKLLIENNVDYSRISDKACIFNEKPTSCTTADIPNAKDFLDSNKFRENKGGCIVKTCDDGYVLSLIHI